MGVVLGLEATILLKDATNVYIGGALATCFPLSESGRSRR